MSEISAKPVIIPTDNDFVDIKIEDAETHGLRAAIVKTLADEGLSPDEIFHRMKGVISKPTINRYYPHPPKQAESGYIYLIEGTQGWYKIGLSKNPVSRIERLDVVLPFSIEVLHLIPTNNMKHAEKELHQRFAEKRGRGEWFALSSDDVETICSIRELNFSGGAS